jgi:hypothetical protein
MKVTLEFMAIVDSYEAAVVTVDEYKSTFFPKSDTRVVHWHDEVISIEANQADVRTKYAYSTQKAFQMTYHAVVEVVEEA